ncbi:unnamed protein product [Ectocarpus sp. 12 AP-2014]
MHTQYLVGRKKRAKAWRRGGGNLHATRVAVSLGRHETTIYDATTAAAAAITGVHHTTVPAQAHQNSYSSTSPTLGPPTWPEERVESEGTHDRPRILLLPELTNDPGAYRHFPLIALRDAACGELPQRTLYRTLVC